MGKWKKYLSCATAVLLSASNLASGVPAFASAVTATDETEKSYVDKNGDEVVESPDEDSQNQSDETEVIDSSEEGKAEEVPAEKDTADTSDARTKDSVQTKESEAKVETKKQEKEPAATPSEKDGDFAVYSAENAADMAAAVAALDDNAKTRLTVSSDTDLSNVLDKGTAVYYDGTYIISFENTSDRKSAYKEIAKEVGDDAVANDTVLSVCDDVTNVNEEKITDVMSDSVKSSAEDGLKVRDEMANGDTLVALIDTGCDEYASASVNLTSDEDADANGHGTRMAKAMMDAAEGTGIRILSIKAFNDDGTASMSNVIAAVKYAEEAGANVINISASVKDSDNAVALKNEVSNAVASGITVVASAGNNGRDAGDYVPANVDGVVTIGAATEKGEILSTSNTGDCVKYYVVADSTSEAAAMFSGFFAAGLLDSAKIYKPSEIGTVKSDVSAEGDSEKLVTNDTKEAMLANGDTVNKKIVELAGEAGNIWHIVVTNSIEDTSNDISMPHTVVETYTETHKESYCKEMRRCDEHSGDDPSQGTHGSNGNYCCAEWDSRDVNETKTRVVNNYIHDNVFSDPIYVWYNAERHTIYFGVPADTHLYMSKNASGIFANLPNLQEVDLAPYDATYTNATTNFAANDKNVKSITYPPTWHFRGTKDSGLPTISEHWHKEDDETETSKIWHIGTNGSGNFEGTNGHTAGDGCDTVDLGTAGDGVGENFTCDTGSTTGFETMFNSDPVRYSGTWLPGLGTSHRYWKTEGVANLNNMIEVHHPEAPFTTYCWAQHRGPNSGYYDRIEIKSEKQMIANLQVYGQNYRSLPTSQLLMPGETSCSNPMTRSFITIMYYGDVENDPLGLRAKYHLSAQELAYCTMGAVQWCSDSAESYTYTSNMYQAKREILSQSYKNIPDAENLKFYIYLSAHEGGGQQQMGMESVQTKYYGGVKIHKINSVGDEMSGCEFTIYSDEACTQPVRTYTSDADGEAGTCRMDAQYGIPVGTYYVKESNTLPGYEQNNDVFKIVVKKDRVTETGYRNGAASKETIEFVNKALIKPEIGKLILKKVSTGDTNKGLVSAVYGVYSAEDIIAERLTGDTVTLYPANTKVATITTGADGTGAVTLQKGAYYVKEEQAPGGYKVDAQTSGNIDIVKGQNSTPTVADDPKTGTFTITAKKIIPKGYQIKAGMFKFELYKQESRLGADGKPALTKVDEATNDANGNVSFKPITYSADENTDYHGEVQYAIKEVAPAAGSALRYLYDDHIEYVAGAVVDDGSDTLKVKLTYSSENSAEDAGFRTTGEFTNSYIKAPDIPNPTKTVSKGKVTLVKDLHNVIDYEDSYQYDVYQPIPVESKVDYFKDFSFYDKFPAGVKVDSWKVFADGKDVTSKWKFTKTTANEKDEDSRQDTVTAVYIGNYNDASMYGVTYNFQFQVTETKEIAKKESFFNYAATSITYQDVENHYILDADGNVQKDASGKPIYEAENPYTKDGNTVADPSFATKTTTDAIKAVHYRTTNEVQTDVYPRFTAKSWDILKHVYNADGDEINTWAVHNGDIVTYKITLQNKSKRMDGKITVTDPLPENVTFVDADNGGQYDESTKKIVWTELPFKAGKTYVVSFRVKVADAGAFIFDNRASAVAACDGARANNTNNPDAPTAEIVGRMNDSKQTLNMHNFVPEMRKIVTDKDGYNINEVLVSENSELTYHLYVYNPDNAGTDPKRSGKHTFTITDKIPENTQLVSISEGGQTVSGIPGVGDLKVNDNQSLVAGDSSASYVSWTEEFNPGEMKVYTFRVKVIGKGVSVVNQAAFATHNTPYDDPDANKPSDTSYPLTPGNTGDPDDPEYPSNVVVNGVPSDPVKEVQTLSGKDIDKQLLQVGDTYQYVITLDNPTACYKTYTLTDTVSEHTDLVKAFESTVTKTDDSVKDVANIKDNPTNTVSVDGRKITWVADIQAGETRQFVFTFKTLDKDAHWTNKAHVVISHNVPIDPTTETPIPDGKDYPIERDTNEVENWTPADPVKSVTTTPNEADGPMDMDQMLVFGENADTLTYKIEFRNNTTEKKMYVLQDTLDTDLDFVKASDGGTYNEADRMIVWRLRLDPGASKSVTFDAKVNVGNRVASANNFVQMLVDQAYPVSNTTDTDIDSTPTKTVTDKDGKDIDDFLVNKGDELTYTIRVHNPDELTKHFTVYDEVPENSELIEAFPGVKTSSDRFGEEVFSKDVAETSTVETAQSRTKIAWEADIPSGETWAFVFRVRTTKKDSYIPNEAKVTVDRSSILTNLVENWVPGDPLKVVTEDGKDVNKKTFFKEDRSKVTYEITAKNPSNIDKTYTITDDLDKNLIFLSADNDGQYDKESGKVTWQVKIAPGETVTVKVNVQFVAEPTQDKITNTANVTCDNWHNVTNTVENYITYAPVKKVLTKSDADLSGKLIFADNEYKYTITWKNPTDEVHTYNITDTLQDHVVFVSADNNGKANGQTVSWNGISVEPGQTGTVSMIVKADFPLENKQVDNKGHVADANEKEKYEHDTNTVTIFISQIQKTVTDPTDYGIYGYLVSPGDTILYHIHVANPSKSNQTVTVTDKLPTGLSYVSSDGKESNGTVTWTDASIPEGGKEFVITAKVTPEAKSLTSIENKAHGSANSTELDSNKVINYVFQEPVKAVVTTEDKKDADGKTVKPEAALTYSVTFKNTSDKPQDFVVTDKVDTRLAVQKINDGGKMGKDNTITWVATLQAGESKTVTFEANAPKSAKQEEIENEATVSVDKTSQKTNKVTVKVTPSAKPTAVDTIKKAVQKVNVRATGDASNMTAWFVMGAAALAAGAAFIIVKKKKNN